MTSRQDAWMEILTKRLADGWSEENAVKQADALLALMEQREREGRFGPPLPEAFLARGEANLRVAALEAEVERLKAELEHVKVDTAGTIELVRAKANKAESLLKEALRVLGKMPRIMRDLSVMDVESESEKVLARARQEGFSDGE